jgi:hypothetical protein
MKKLSPAQVQALISSHKEQIAFLFQRYQYNQPVTMMNIAAASRKYGTPFIKDLAAIISGPVTTTDRLGIIRSVTAGSDVNLDSLAGPSSTAPDGGSGGSSGWDFLTDLINIVADVYQDSTNKGTPAPVVITPQVQPQQQTIGGIPTNTLLLIGMAAVVVILIVVLIKK